MPPAPGLGVVAVKRALVLIMLAACGGGGDNPDAGPLPDAGTWTGEDLAGACPLAERVGGFTIESGGNAPVVFGSVADSVLPISVLTELDSAGGCTILRKENPFCEPPCGPNETCALDETCVAYPRNQGVGAITVTGLAAEIVMQPDVTKNYSNTTITEPLFADDALIQLSAAGDELGAFTLRGVGSDDLVLATNDITIVPGDDLEIAYTASGRTDVTIYFRLNVDQHGNSPGFLYCAQEDTGTLTIPAALVDGLLELGQSGVPNAYMSRRTTDSVDIGPGCADLVVSETIPPNQLHVIVEGVHYCTPPMMCPKGETCNFETFICEPDV
jgi:hypothetical protein